MSAIDVLALPLVDARPCCCTVSCPAHATAPTVLATMKVLLEVGETSRLTTEERGQVLEQVAPVLRELVAKAEGES